MVHELETFAKGTKFLPEANVRSRLATTEKNHWFFSKA